MTAARPTANPARRPRTPQSAREQPFYVVDLGWPASSPASFTRPWSRRVESPGLVRHAPAAG